MLSLILSLGERIEDRVNFGKSPITQEIQEKLLTILNVLENDPNSIDFLEPVDFLSYNIPDYPKIIKYPMDLGTVKKKLVNNRYTSIQKFLNDIQLIWDNCKTYNMTGSDIYKMAVHCERLFKKNFEKVFHYSLNYDESVYPQEEVLGINEKIELKNKIEKLNAKKLLMLYNFLKKNEPEAIVSNGKNYEIQIDKITKSAQAEIEKMLITK